MDPATEHPPLIDMELLLPGAFCSQLVVDAMVDVGLDPLVKDVSRKNVTPEMLADPERSRLRQLPHVECKADEHRPCDNAQLQQMRSIHGSFIGIGMNRYRKRQQHAMAEIAKLDASLAEQTRQTSARLNDLTARSR